MGMVLLHSDTTASEARNPSTADQEFRTTNADATTRKFYNINENHYQKILVRGTVKIVSAVGSVVQAVVLRVVVGDAALTAGQSANAASFSFTTKAAVDQDFITVEHIAEQNAKDEAFIELLAAADATNAATTVVLQNFSVFGIDN